VKTAEYLAMHPAFSLDEAERALAPAGGRAAAFERLNHHVGAGHLRRVARGLYAVVLPGVAPARFHPDPFLVAASARPDAIFSHHSALELLGVAHSAWTVCTAYLARWRRPLACAGSKVRFLDLPDAFRTKAATQVGTRTLERRWPATPVGPTSCGSSSISTGTPRRW